MIIMITSMMMMMMMMMEKATVGEENVDSGGEDISIISMTAIYVVKTIRNCPRCFAVYAITIAAANDNLSWSLTPSLFC